MNRILCIWECTRIIDIQNGDILREILKIFESEYSFENGGYNVDYQVVDSSSFGIPQKERDF